MEKVISNSEALFELLKPGRKIAFIFSFPELDIPSNKFWQARIQKDYHACGCETGAAFALTAATLAIGYLVCRFFLTGHGIYTGHIMWSMAVILGAAGMGKFLGISLAKIRLKKKIGALSETLHRMSA